MAHHKSAIKRIRQTERRNLVNGARRGKVRTEIKKVESAIAVGNAQEAAKALRAAQPVIMKGVSKGVVTKQAAARKMSRLSARVKALAA